MCMASELFLEINVIFSEFENNEKEKIDYGSLKS